jgi:hypothetical protein
LLGEEIPEGMLERFLERKGHAANVAAPRLLDDQRERGRMLALEDWPCLGREDPIDFGRVRQRNEQGLRKPKSYRPGGIDQFDCNQLRLVRSNLRIPDDPIARELKPRQPIFYDGSGEGHSLTFTLFHQHAIRVFGRGAETPTRPAPAGRKIGQNLTRIPAL